MSVETQSVASSAKGSIHALQQCMYTAAMLSAMVAPTVWNKLSVNVLTPNNLPKLKLICLLSLLSQVVSVSCPRLYGALLQLYFFNFNFKLLAFLTLTPVSYTHLTLPTNREV